MREIEVTAASGDSRGAVRVAVRLDIENGTEAIIRRGEIAIPIKGETNMQKVEMIETIQGVGLIEIDVEVIVVIEEKGEIQMLEKLAM
jgi:hypothetical protein